MTSDDVKFSLDKARATKGGWEFLDVAIKSVDAPDPTHRRDQDQVPVGAAAGRPRELQQRGPAQGLRGQEPRTTSTRRPVGTGPFVWDHWTKGSEIKLKKNPTYWDTGKPALDSVTWKVVPDDNSRNVQIQGGQAQINENPPFSSVEQLKGQPGVKVDLFPSTKTDYVMMNQNEKPYDDVHVRRAISYAIDREALVKTLLFGNGTPANSFLMPNVPFYDPATPGLSYDMAKAKEELAQSSVPNGFTTTFLASLGRLDRPGDRAGAAVLAQAARDRHEDPERRPERRARPAARARSTRSATPTGRWTSPTRTSWSPSRSTRAPGSHSFYTSYNNAQVIADTKKAEQTFDDAGPPGALQRDPEAGGRRRVHGLPLLLALQLRLQHQGAAVSRSTRPATTTSKT